jgi:hypothetical protein
MLPNSKPSETIACLADIAPISQGVGTASSGWVPVKNFHAIMAEIKTGVLGTSATVDAKIQQATSAAGAGAKDITGKGITQIVKATGDNKTVFVNVRPQELDTNGNFAFIQLTITVGTAASLVTGTLLGFASRFGPASDLNDSDVVQVI